MSLISSSERTGYRHHNTRTITLPDGRSEAVYMPPSLWRQYSALLDLEDLCEADIVQMALNEKEAQSNASFGECFRCIVTSMVIDWFEAAESAGLEL